MNRAGRSPIVVPAAMVALALTIGGCHQTQGEVNGRDAVITLSMWHYYRDQMRSVADSLVAEFNATVGRERGIVVNVTSIVDASTQQDKLEAIANDDPGAPTMPDLASAYPSTALALEGAGLLASLDPYLTESDLNAYVPSFVDEGRLNDGRLYVFPVAKSTEALFLNRTAFERFSAATGATTASLATFEGLAQVATSYYEWTDGLTPDTPNDGRSFMAPDSWFNLALVQCAQLGGSFVGTNTLRTDGAAFDRAWDFAALPTLGGAFTVAEGYSSDYAVTGEVIAALGSTAGILYYGDTVTYADNTQEHVDYEVLPYPVWEGGQKVALQRGAGLVVASSDASREAAAVVFLKWLTAPEQNLRFVRSTGYLPVTTEAYAERMDQEIAAAEDPKIAELLTTAVAMQAEYRFMTAPLQGNLNALSEAYEDSLKAGLKEGRVKVEQGQPAATVAHGLRASLFPG